MTRERVLTIPREMIASLYAYRQLDCDPSHLQLVCDAVSANGKWINRPDAENSLDRVQVIACSVVRSRNGLLRLRRSLTGSRANLRGRQTLMFGGHVDQSDQTEKYPIQHCAKRELEEELGIESCVEHKVIGLAIDPLSLSGWMHIGVVFQAVIDDDSIKLNSDLDVSEFTKNAVSEYLSFVDDDLLADERDALDPWSRLYLDKLMRAGEDMQQAFFNFVWQTPTL